MDQAQREVVDGERFAFGANWYRFLSLLDDQRIAEAEGSLREMLGADRLDGLRLLDAGSGSGLFSLAARRLGATVHSFDFDPDSVACTRELKNRYFPNDPAWTIEQGSVLDPKYIATLGRFDVVYSWGVLHHTGAMWKAIDNVAALVDQGGRFFVSLYNDQGRISEFWRLVKKTYNEAPSNLRPLFVGVFGVPLLLPTVLRGLVRGKSPRESLANRGRGMSVWHDLIDWVGGYPFEVAKPEQVFDFCRNRGLQLERLKTCGGRLGCNEFVFTRSRVPTGGSSECAIGERPPYANMRENPAPVRPESTRS
jgi:2-polyprenyl-3-methyl-5-hydroxy-6-metoxy-1,4-benzoquinol methylase